MADDNAPRVPNLNYDVLLNVFPYLDPWGDSPRPIRENQRALAKAARSCKALSDLALDVLWRKLDNLGHLLALLSSLKHVSTIDVGDGDEDADRDLDDNAVLEFKYPAQWLQRGDISPQEWLRFQQYARRVFVVSHIIPSILEASVFSLLLHLNGEQPLLPRVERLEYDQWHPFDPSILFLASPSLRTLHVDYRIANFARDAHDRRPNVALNLLLRNASAGTPLTREVDVSLLALTPDQVPMTKCNNLREIALLSWESIFDCTLLRGLSGIHNLVDLSLSVHVDDEYFTAVQHFGALRKLTLQGRCDRVAQFIETGALSAPQLHTLHLDVTPIGDQQVHDLHRCIEAVSSRYHRSLRKFHLLSKMWGDPARREQSLLHVLQPLLELHDLEIIHVTPLPRGRLTLSDETLREIALAFPNLTDFMIDLYPTSTEPSPASLVELATHCPGLRKLHLPYLDLKAFIDAGDYPNLAHGLHVLKIGNDIHGLNSAHLKASPFAQLLDRVFPKLDLERSDLRASRRPGLNTHCPEVIEVLRTLQMARRKAG